MPISIDSKSKYCPQLGNITNTRLIDCGFIHCEASAAGCSERYGRGESSHTIHVWWARRPHSAMRMMVFASLSKEISAKAKQIMQDIGADISINKNSIKKASKFICDQYKDKPNFLDMFGGGGTIPFEALNLGANTYSIDANPLSVFVQKCTLEYSQQTSIADVQRALKIAGERVLKQLEKCTDDLFPLRKPDDFLTFEKGATAYLWSYSFNCPACQFKYYLTKRSWVSKKNGKNLAFVISDNKTSQSITINKVKDHYSFQSSWNGRKGSVSCPKCGHTEESISILNCNDELLAIIRPNSNGPGKLFDCNYINAIPDDNYLASREEDLLRKMHITLPTSVLPKWSGIINPAIYGIETHADFLNKRQRIVLLELIKLLGHEYENAKNEYGDEAAKFLIGLLSGLIDQLVDWNCRLSMWIPQNEQVGRGFCGPGVSMLWDYTETDPIMSGPSNLYKKLHRIIEGSKSLEHFHSKAIVQHAFAQELPFDDSFFDSIVTDPPYYDNIFYSPLADFIYAWKRLLFEKIEPNIFGTLSTENNRELVASKFRAGTAEKAHQIYCRELTLAIKEACRVLKDDGVFAFIYSHNSLRGWEALIKAYRCSDLCITSVQPLSIERKQRPRAMTSEAVNTCIAFVSRKSNNSKQPIVHKDLEGIMQKIIHSNFTNELLRSGWHDEDVAMAVFAHGVAILANHEHDPSTSDIDRLSHLSHIVGQRFSTFKISSRGSL